MLRMAVGQAECLDERCATRSAVAACRAGLAGAAAEALLLFAGAEYDHGLILDILAEAFPGVPLVGCTSAGEMSGMVGVSEDSVCLVAFSGDGVTFTAGVARGLTFGPEEAVREALAEAGAAEAPCPAICLVFPDGTGGRADETIKALAASLGPDCPIFGGLPGRLLDAVVPIRQFFGGDALSDAAPFLLIRGQIPSAFSLSKSWKPVGGRERATGVSGGLVRRIGNKSAVDFYRYYLGPHAEPAIELPLAVYCDQEKDFYIRSPAFYSEDDGSILFPAGVPEGAWVQLTEASRADILADAKRAAVTLAKGPGAAWTPAGVLVFSCNTRKQILGTRTDEEIAAFKAALPPGTPIAGFYCFGEVCPSGPGKTVRLHNGTMVALVLGGEPPAVPAVLPEPLDAACAGGEAEAREREERFLKRKLDRAENARERLEIQKELSSTLLRTVNREISEAKLEIQRKNELLREALALAEEVQRNLLPQASPGLPGFDIAGKSLYSDETGGDYFDFIEAPSGCPDLFGVIIGDVTGHGIAAALLMTTARAFLRMRSFTPGSLAAVVDDVNKMLCADVADTGRFMTLFYLAIDTEKRRLHWVRAGHDPIILFDAATGLAADIPDKGGPPLGIVSTARYAENHTDGLTTGQVILLGTDGLWEARNAAGEMFGKDRVRELLQENADKDAAGIVEAVIAGHSAYLGEAAYEDDVTLVVIKVLPEGAGQVSQAGPAA